jgi:hypothetical protein
MNVNYELCSDEQGGIIGVNLGGTDLSFHNLKSLCNLSSHLETCQFIVMVFSTKLRDSSAVSHFPQTTEK